MLHGIILCLLLSASSAKEICEHVKDALNGYVEHRCFYPDKETNWLTINGTAPPQATLGPIPSGVESVAVLQIVKVVGRILPGAFDNFKTLKWLSLRNNSIRQLPPGIFADLDSLTWLNLRNNQIENFIPLAELPRNLRTASFDHNQIKRLAGLKDLPRTLRTLDLFGNALASFVMDPSTPGYQLQDLQLAKNRIKEYYTPQLTKLKSLYLQGNLLGEISGDMLKGLEELESLYLSKNRIELIERGALAHTPALKTLDLSGNRIRVLNEDVSLPKSLAALHVSGNRLQYFHVRLFAGTPKLKKIKVHGNPFNCGCLELLLKWIERLRMEIHCREYLFGEAAPACVVHTGDKIHDCLYQYYEEDVEYYLENRYTKSINDTMVGSSCLD